MNKRKNNPVKRGVVKKRIVEENNDELYTVIKLRDESETLFDCIPDNWFVDENQDSCYWPPPKGKNVAVRALKREEPNDWQIYECEVVKRGFGKLLS